MINTSGILRVSVYETRSIHDSMNIKKKTNNEWSRDMRFPTMWYVRPAMAQISLCLSLEYYMAIELLTEHHLDLNECCTGWSESTRVNMPNWWKSHATAQIIS